ncbi:hypothetical protein NA56DRAFT_560704 [Hyaloscypha hepaticicola]|uniref:Mitochondrial carrier protein pet8 n=1 Tax=Hyaloscypha hepaticicola TaxID=2082293 RepID=A0A2J6QMM0_9HELO|nr:hypothetical protein NA56DRAFT_560704 [Hyaloscypha hepaticicola]
MSFLVRNARFATRPVIARQVVPSRAFTVSSVRALKEDDRHNEDQAEHNERHKQDQLQKQKEGKGHWKPELASNSEEAVAADRQAGDHSVEELQKKTAKHAEEKHK